MIRCKSNIEELIQNNGGIKYYKDSSEIDVSLKDDEKISIRYNNPKSIVVNYYDYDEAISALYKDRKYINRIIS